LDDVEVLAYEQPWDLLRVLHGFSGRGVLVSDLYSPDYSKKRPVRTPAHPESPDTDQESERTVTESAIDRVDAYLRPFVQEHALTPIVYSHMPDYWQHPGEWSDKLGAALAEVNLQLADVVRRSKEQGYEDDELSEIAGRIEFLRDDVSRRRPTPVASTAVRPLRPAYPGRDIRTLIPGLGAEGPREGNGLPTVYVIEDNLTTARRIGQKLVASLPVRPVEYEYLWDLLHYYDVRGKAEGQVVVTDLYVAGYWDVSPKPPAQGKAPRGPRPDSPENIYRAVLDVADNYLRPACKEYGFRVVVYSHVMRLLELKARLHEAQDVWEALVASGIAEEDILDKGDLVGSDPAELDRLVNRVGIALQAVG